MEFKDLKQGMLIKWRADRMFKEWDTFGKVVSIKRVEVTIQTFDDFKETTLSRGGEAVRDEISPATKEEVFDYIELRISVLNSLKTEATVCYKKQMRNLDEKISKLSDCSKEYLDIAN